MKTDWRLLTTEEAATQLQTSPDAIRRYCHSGILRHRRQGRVMLIEQRSVLALMKVIQHAVQGRKPTPPRRGRGPAQEVVEAVAAATALDN